MLEELWPRGDVIDHSTLMILSQRAYELCADAQDPKAGVVPAEAPLLDGLFYALDELQRDDKEHALDAVDQAYWILVSLELPDFRGYGEDLDQLARSSKPCIEEMEFQLDLLEFLEAHPDPQSDYDGLLRAMNEWVRLRHSG